AVLRIDEVRDSRDHALLFGALQQQDSVIRFGGGGGDRGFHFVPTFYTAFATKWNLSRPTCVPSLVEVRMRARIAFYLYIGVILGLITYQVGARHLALAAATPSAPERKASGNTVTSERDPRIKIEVPKSAKYVGADRWILYGVADCEIHGYVDA